MKATKKICGFVLAVGCSLLATLRAQNIYVANQGNGTIGEYGPDGHTINASLVSGLSGNYGIAISGNDLFVVNQNRGTVGEYTLSGATVNASLITGLNNPYCIAVLGTNLLVSNGTNTIGEYTTSGATVNALFITGLDAPQEIAISGNNLFVVNWNRVAQINGFLIIENTYGTVGEYTTSGATVNASLISGLWEPSGIAAYGGNLYIANNNQAYIGEYTTSGQAINPTLISALGYPEGVRVFGTNLFVVNSSPGVIGEYTTSGATINASLISGLNVPADIAIGPGMPQLNIVAIGGQIVLFYPAWATNYILQCATNPASTCWQTVTACAQVMLVTNGAPVIAVTLTNTLPTSFFRLQASE